MEGTMSNCIFESRTDTSSATICKHCGKQKFEHTIATITYTKVAMSKQTAVDFLVSILNKDGFAPVLTDEEIQQAKQMEKEQMKEAHLIADHYPRGYEFDKWYNETYGGNNDN
jgi:hypothetical protein